MNIKFLSSSLFVLSIFFTSCNGNADEAKKIELDSLDSLTASTDKVAISTNEDSDVSYSLPSSLQIAYVFKKSGAAFVPDLLNNRSNAVNYNISNYKRAVNFGVYSADLAYCLFNKRYQESKEYLKACKDMGSYLGLNQAFESDNMANRFDKNIANEDSVIKIVSSVQLKTDAMFEQNKQRHITFIAFTGAWTESTYIAFEVYAKNKNKKVLSSLLEQLLLSETIIKALNTQKNSEPEMASLISSVEKINSKFNSISGVKAAMEKDEEMDFDFMTVTDGELKAIGEEVKVLRTSMID